MVVTPFSVPDHGRLGGMKRRLSRANSAGRCRMRARPAILLNMAKKERTDGSSSTISQTTDVAAVAPLSPPDAKALLSPCRSHGLR